MLDLPGLGFHHVGVACDDLDADERVFSALGYQRERPECVDEIQGVRARFLTGAGPRIELVCSLPGRGVLSDWLKKGTKLYHIAYEVDSLESVAGAFAALGAKQVVTPVPGSAFGMRLICFYMLPNLMLVELISRS